MDTTPDTAEDFVLRIVDVFRLTGRGVVVIALIESGIVRTGEEVEIWDAEEFVMSAVAAVELVCRRHPVPGEVGLRLGEVDVNRLHRGQIVRGNSRREVPPPTGAPGSDRGRVRSRLEHGLGRDNTAVMTQAVEWEVGDRRPVRSGGDAGCVAMRDVYGGVVTHRASRRRGRPLRW